jgi:hypothetical protein
MTGGSVMVNHGRGLQVASLACFGDSVFTKCLQKPSRSSEVTSS